MESPAAAGAPKPFGTQRASYSARVHTNPDRSAAHDWQWSLVTGASSGIGEAIALHLASIGVNVVLVGRDVQRLRSVAAVASAADVEAEIIAADLAEEGGVARVCARLEVGEPAIDLLVNNAGAGQFGQFIDLPPEGAVEVMRVNNEALVRLTSAALTGMRKRGHGTIVQISSTASTAPGPHQAVYAASKAFVTSFGQALSAELTGTGITCTTVIPGRTRTRYFERAGAPVDVPEWRWMSADDVARSAIAGARLGEPIVVPGRGNRRYVMLSSSFPSLPVGRALQLVRRVLGAVRNSVRGRSRAE